MTSFKAKLHQVTPTTSKFNAKQAVRLDLTTPLGIKSKTINIGGKDFQRLQGVFHSANIYEWQGKELDIALKPSAKNPKWLDVVFNI